jgi:hypothetical protein
MCDQVPCLVMSGLSQDSDVDRNWKKGPLIADTFLGTDLVEDRVRG